MSTIIQPLPLLQPTSAEDISKLEIHLPTLKVVSYSGPGNTGGVPASLEPIVRRLGTKVHWFFVENQQREIENNGASPGVLSQVRLHEAQPNSGSAFEFYTTGLPQQLIDGHRRLSARYLWPLLHGIDASGEFDHEDWKAYRQLCARVSSECQSILFESFPTLCWLHDYQLSLCAPLIASEHGTIVCQFWHVPWPDAKIMSAQPISKELAEALLCNRLLGFHTQEYAHNFLQTVETLIPTARVDHMDLIVQHKGSKTQLTVMPLGIDVAKWQRLARLAKPMAEALAVKHRLANQIILGIDRLDYTKGVFEKLEGLKTFLSNETDMHRRFHYVQISQNPQSKERQFADYAQRVKEKIAEINKRFGTQTWEPILHIEAHLSQKELAAWYQAADVMTVNPIRDGLNLIAKEYVACRQDEQGVLVLSERAGCAHELSQGALIVSPTSNTDFAQNLGRALSMAVEEKRCRMTSMRRVIGWNQLHDWALGFLRQALS